LNGKSVANVDSKVQLGMKEMETVSGGSSCSNGVVGGAVGGALAGIPSGPAGIAAGAIGGAVGGTIAGGCFDDLNQTNDSPFAHGA
jgi:Bacteriocin class II with double-glycine leader peptide